MARHRLMKTLLVCLLVQAALASSPTGPANLAQLLSATKATRMAQLLAAARVDAAALPGAVTGTLFVPSDAALGGLLGALGVSDAKALQQQPQLADLIVAYHFMPGYALKSKADVPRSPSFGVSGDANYALRFTRDALGAASVQDVQGNRVPLAKDILRMRNLVVVPIDAALMSGAYFTSAAAALRHYPQWSTAAQLHQQHGSTAAAATQSGSGRGGVTFFVPSDAALAADAPRLTRLPGAVAMLAGDDGSVRSRAKLVAALSAGQVPQLLASHMSAPAVAITAASKSREAASLAAANGGSCGASSSSSSTIKLDVGSMTGTNRWARQQLSAPVVRVSTGGGQPANITLYNIYAGKDILHGIDRMLLPAQPQRRGAGAAAQASGGGPAAPRAAAASTTSGGSSLTAGAAAAAASGSPRRRLAQSWVGTSSPANNPAATFAAANTASALQAASYGSARWADWGGFGPSGDCFNCVGGFPPLR